MNATRCLRALAALLFFAAGCGDSRKDPSTLSIEIAGGNGQTARAGSPLPEPLTVLVRSEEGRPVEGATVSFRVTAGGGRLDRDSAVTDEAGTASVRWTLGSPPVWNRVLAETQGASVEARAWADPGPEPPKELVALGPAGTESEGLAFRQGRGLFLGSPGALLNLAGPGGSLSAVPLTGERILSPVGMAFGPAGDLFVCESSTAEGGSIKRISPSGACAVLAEGFQGVPFSLPNSLAVDQEGNLFLSATCDGNIYRVSAEDGSTELFLSIPGPNGLALNAEGTHLYFTTEDAAIFCGRSGSLGGGLYRVPVEADGSPGALEPLVQDFALAGDGLAFDCEGNLYAIFTSIKVSGLSGLLTSALYVLTPDGRFNRYASVDLLAGGIFTNVAFGVDPFDPSSLYAYGFSGKVYRLPVGIRGLPLP